MGTSPGIVEGEWDDQPHNWKTFFKRWRRSKELFRLEVVRTETMSADDFFVIGRPTAGRVLRAGDALVVDIGDEPVPTRVVSIDHAAQGDSGEGGDDFHMLLVLKLDGIGPDSGVEPGTIIRQPG
ncbi:hypothetical protein [Candidatus Poriferisocius sp.]|uniref:hypothetical protein n=1 Tax=Candidatus Poriferisocius sp. TaxID=3101276 RepID=UPI003B01E145